MYICDAILLVQMRSLIHKLPPHDISCGDVQSNLIDRGEEASLKIASRIQADSIQDLKFEVKAVSNQLIRYAIGCFLGRLY